MITHNYKVMVWFHAAEKPYPRSNKRNNQLHKTTEERYRYFSKRKIRKRLIYPPFSGAWLLCPGKVLWCVACQRLAKGGNRMWHPPWWGHRPVEGLAMAQKELQPGCSERNKRGCMWGWVNNKRNTCQISSVFLQASLDCTSWGILPHKWRAKVARMYVALCYVLFAWTHLSPEMRSQGLQMPACKGMHCRKGAGHKMCALSYRTVGVQPSLWAPRDLRGTSTFRKDVVTVVTDELVHRNTLNKATSN